MAVGHSPPVTGTVAGAIRAVGQIEIPPKVGVEGTGAVNVGANVGVGKVGAKVGVKVGVNVGKVGAVVAVGAVPNMIAVGQSEIPPPPKVGVVGTGAVMVGVKVGVKGAVNVGKVGVNVAAGAVPNMIAVGQSEIPPPPKVGAVGTGAVKVGVKVGSISAVIPGAIAGMGAVVTVVTGDVIIAKPLDEIKIKTVKINKSMKNNRSDFI